MSELTDLGVAELLQAFGTRRVSPVEVVDAISARIDAIDSAVGGFTALSLERARDEARAAEAAWSRGEPRALEGIPFGVKDLFDTEAVRTAYGSPMFDSHVPERDAEAVRRARAAGAVLVGKTQTHEFAWGITSVNERMGTARNPWARDRVSGGSSGGSAVVLAAGEVPLTLGSDTGGSIRVPASFCGVVGLKPTYGRVSAAGAWPLARSLDHPGPMARTPVDVALLLEAIAGVDPADPATSDVALGDIHGELHRGLAGLVVGLCPDLHLVPLSPDIQAVFDATLATLEAQGARLETVSLPEAELSYPAFGVIQRAEALDTHRRAGLYPARRDEYGADVLGRLDAAAAVTLEDYLAAACRPGTCAFRLRSALSVVRCPPHPCQCRGSAADRGRDGPPRWRRAAFRDLVMSYTTPQDLVGLPACAVRAGFDEPGNPCRSAVHGPAVERSARASCGSGALRGDGRRPGRRPPLP